MKPKEKTIISPSKYGKDKTGQRFNRLVVLGDSGQRKFKAVVWLCQCDCGQKTFVDTKSLTTGNIKSCGCLQREAASRMCKEERTTHGMTKTRLYRVWRSMKCRCLLKTNISYPYYGGRGVKICNEWLSFEPFMQWALSNGYKDNLTIDRIDVDDDYKPDNCKWSTMAEQNRNQRRHKARG